MSIVYSGFDGEHLFPFRIREVINQLQNAAAQDMKFMSANGRYCCKSRRHPPSAQLSNPTGVPFEINLARLIDFLNQNCFTAQPKSFCNMG
jgi:hypothetical protein